MASLLLGALPVTPIYSSSARFSSSQSESLTGISLRITTSSSLSIPTISLSPVPDVYCGRGDAKTAKGKRFKHSFGNARPKSKKNGRGPPRIPAPPAAPKKDPFEDGEVVKIEIDESFAG
ncbi:small ribosomal subunit protein bTHXc-like [Rutidosis leptorrhynchoides]|uniref:small ribosomal subunit protein bTHXc-like n=1 Tax=Rutidosis leptorrhynchoides TaxID=125765 RepID=UPI003A9A2852